MYQNCKLAVKLEMDSAGERSQCFTSITL